MSMHNPKLIQWYIDLHLGILNDVHYDLVIMSGQSNFQFVYERFFFILDNCVFFWDWFSSAYLLYYMRL